MDNDYNDINKENSEKNMSLDELFDAPVEQANDPDDYFYTIPKAQPEEPEVYEEDASEIIYDEPETEKVIISKAEKKHNPIPERKENKKGKGIAVIAIVLVLALVAGAYFIFFRTKKFDVSFIDESGNIIETVKVKEGSTVGLIEAPKKEGYVFIEWQLNGKKYDATSLVGSDLKLKAFYKKAFNVTFLTEDKKDFLKVEVGEGEKVEKPEKVPEVKDKAFVAWMTEDNKIYSFDSAVTKDLTLVAKMKKYVKPTGIAYSQKDNNFVYVNQTKAYKAVVTPSNTTETVSYTSSDPTIFSVDQNGNVKGLKEGKATLRAKVEDLTAEIYITVKNISIEFSELLKNNNKIKIGETKTFIPDITPVDMSVELTYESSDPSIFKVDKDGKVTGVNEGKAVLRAKGNNVTAEMNITVEGVPVTDVSAKEGNSLRLARGKDITLTPVVLPENATIKTLKYESSDESIAKVSESGVITPVSKGNCQITLRSHNDKTYVINVEVYVQLERLELQYDQPSETYIGQGESVTITAKYFPEDADISGTIQWTQPPNAGERNLFGVSFSNNDYTLIVSAGPGAMGLNYNPSYMVSASLDGIEASNPITIYIKTDQPTEVFPTNITFSEGNSVKIAKGSSMTLHPTITPDNATYKDVSYSSSNESVAIVSSGELKGLSAGSCVITASTVNGLTYVINVEVTE